MLFLLEAGLIAQTPNVAQPAGTEAIADAVVQAAATGPAQQLTSSHETVPRVPGMANLFRGFNAGVNYSGAHNSYVGWYSAMTPAVSYAFSSRYSADVSSTVYFKRKYLATVTGNAANRQWIEEAVGNGDTLFGFHAAFIPGPVEDVATFTLSAPTGDVAAGLGTGHVTFDFTNHVEHFHKQLGMFLDVGAGNSSVVFNNLVDKNYSTLGALAHFMAGAEYWLGNRFFLEGLMYEQLPLGTQTIYTPPTVRGQPTRPGPPTTTSTSTGANEDNGVTAYLGMPLTGNLTLSGYYSRSLRRHLDTVSFGFTWVLRGRRSDPIVDRALREAETPAPQN